VPAVEWRELERPAEGATSRELRERVRQARKIQRGRGVATNAEIPDRNLDALVDATSEARALLGRAVDSLHLSARAARRLLRVARTLADLEGEARVTPVQVAEALRFRHEVPLT
jgi:magnesium chelatase family protein